MQQNRIKKFRNAQNITGAALAAMCGWKPSRLRNYENHIRCPNLEAIRKLVDAFNLLGCNVTLQDIFPNQTSLVNPPPLCPKVRKSIAANIELVRSHKSKMTNEIDINRADKTIEALQATLDGDRHREAS